jgi:hypothetical protein
MSEGCSVLVYALLGVRLRLRRSVSAIGSALVAEILATSLATGSLGRTIARCMPRAWSVSVADLLVAVAQVLDAGPSGARSLSRASSANAVGLPGPCRRGSRCRAHVRPGRAA